MTTMQDTPLSIVKDEGIFSGNAQERRARFALRFSLYARIAASFAAAGALIFWLIMPEYQQFLYYLLAIVPTIVASFAYPFLHRRGLATPGIYGMLLGLWLIMFAAPLVLPRINMPGASVGFVAVIVMSNLLLGRRASMGMNILSLAGFLVDVALYDTLVPTWFLQLEANIALLGAIFIGAVVMLPTIFIVRLTVAGLEGKIDQVEAASRDIEERASREQAQREQLETATEEIEQRIYREQQQNVALRDLLRQIKDASERLSQAAAEILAVTTQQIASATEQEAAVTQTMATVDEVRTTVTQTAERAQSVADAAAQSMIVSESGEGAVNDSMEGMQAIQERVTDIATTILALSERTQQIGEIIDTVNEIADQSKLLALNASIEAARAGEEGRGFAVVAMEVRQLAEQSRQATARVAGILNEIQQATNTAVMVTEEGSKQADSGAQLVDMAGDAIRDLAVTLETSAQAATQIAASTHQQANGMDQLAAAMNTIRQATTQAAASTRQAEESARSLAAMAGELEALVVEYDRAQSNLDDIVPVT
jgi:methyl-accepting chemotaxis protein